MREGLSGQLRRMKEKSLQSLEIARDLFSKGYYGDCSAKAYWALKESNKFHDSSCEWVQKIKAENKIVFKTKEMLLRQVISHVRFVNPKIIWVKMP